MADNRVAHVQAEDHVSTFRRTILHNVFPVFFVGVLLLLGPGLARGEVERVRIGRPGESVHFFLALGYGESFASVGRDQVDLRDLFIFRISFRVNGIAFLSGGNFAFGEKSDPAAIR